MKAKSRFIRFEVQQFTDGNELDGLPDSWDVVRDVFGEVTPLTSREYEQAQQVQSATTHRIKTRYFEGAKSTMRLASGSRTFNVESVVNEGERNRWLLWRCEEVV